MDGNSIAHDPLPIRRERRFGVCKVRRTDHQQGYEWAVARYANAVKPIHAIVNLLWPRQVCQTVKVLKEEFACLRLPSHADIQAPQCTPTFPRFGSGLGTLHPKYISAEAGVHQLSPDSTLAPPLALLYSRASPTPTMP